MWVDARLEKGEQHKDFMAWRRWDLQAPVRDDTTCEPPDRKWNWKDRKLRLHHEQKTISSAGPNKDDDNSS